MKKINQILITLFLLLPGITSLTGFGQGSGEWELHSSYVDMSHTVATDFGIFVAGDNSIFYFDPEDKSKNSLSKNDGLTGISISALAYDTITKTVFVGYKDGNIDLISENLNVTNLNDIQRTSSVVGSKKINAIFPAGDLVYISTDFGIVVYDQSNDGIKETYRNIGPNGEEGVVTNTVYESSSNTIYSQTEFGLCTATVGTDNLLDFNNWEYLKDSTGSYIDRFNFMTIFKNSLYLTLSDQSKGTRGIYKLENNEFKNMNLKIVDWSAFYGLSATKNRLIATYFSHVIIYDETRDLKEISSDAVLHNATIDSDENIWCASNSLGLITDRYGETRESYAPNGPGSANIFNFYSKGDVTIGLSGGYNPFYAPSNLSEGIYIYENVNWTNINRNTTPSLDILDPINAEYDPVEDRYFISSFRHGLIVWDTEDNFDILSSLDSTGIPFYTIIEDDPNENQTRITSSVIDDNRKLWVTNHRTSGNPSVHSLNLITNEWESFSLKSSNALDPLDLKIDASGNKWILGKGSSVIVWNDETNDEKEFTTQSGKGALPSSSINDIELDKTDQLWVATNEGVAVFQNLDEALTSSFYEASLPISEQRPLLQDEQVNGIAIDGANRKWFATGNGAFLYNETGTELINSFNTENSLLPSNNVLTVSVNESSGQVFFGTDLGIASYWGDASEPEETFTDAKIFPNPVTPNFDGFVTINGLKESAIVKITDISGALIYEQSALGGTVTWDARTLNGEKAQTGVYLIYSTDEEFEESFIGKLVVNN